MTNHDQQLQTGQRTIIALARAADFGVSAGEWKTYNLRVDFPSSGTTWNTPQTDELKVAERSSIPEPVTTATEPGWCSIAVGKDQTHEFAPCPAADRSEGHGQHSWRVTDGRVVFWCEGFDECEGP